MFEQRRTRALAKVAGFGLAVALGAAPVAPSTTADASDSNRRVISTFPKHSGTICCKWTMGQTFRAPIGHTRLRAFTVRMYSSGPVAVRAYLYRWNPGVMRATDKPIWQGVQHLRRDHPKRLRFSADGAQLCCGKRYVFFVSMSEGQRGEVNWSIDLSPRMSYPSGRFVYQQTGHDTRRWTQRAWRFIASSDLSFRMVLMR